MRWGLQLQQHLHPVRGRRASGGSHARQRSSFLPGSEPVTSLLLQMPEQPVCAVRPFQQSWSISYVQMLSGRLCGAAVVVSV